MLERLRDGGVVVIDGGMGTQLEARGAPMDHAACAAWPTSTRPTLCARSTRTTSARALTSSSPPVPVQPARDGGGGVFGDRVGDMNRAAVYAAIGPPPRGRRARRRDRRIDVALGHLRRGLAAAAGRGPAPRLRRAGRDARARRRRPLVLEMLDARWATALAAAARARPPGAGPASGRTSAPTAGRCGPRATARSSTTSPRCSARGSASTTVVLVMSTPASAGAAPTFHLVAYDDALRAAHPHQRPAPGPRFSDRTPGGVHRPPSAARPGAGGGRPPRHAPQQAPGAPGERATAAAVRSAAGEGARPPRAAGQGPAPNPGPEPTGSSQVQPSLSRAAGASRTADRATVPVEAVPSSRGRL